MVLNKGLQIPPLLFTRILVRFPHDHADIQSIPSGQILIDGMGTKKGEGGLLVAEILKLFIEAQKIGFEGLEIFLHYRFLIRQLNAL